MDLSGSTTYSKTWSELIRSKRNFYDLLPIFWLTPLADGLKELEECDCDRFFRWQVPIVNGFEEIRHLCNQSHPPNATFSLEIPIGLFETAYYEDYRVISCYEKLKNNTDIDFKLLPPPSPVGCMRYEWKDGYFFNANTLNYLFQYWKINNAAADVFDKNSLRLLEIGGGYGGFAYQVICLNKKAKYVIIDLPETLILSIYFLSQNFPEMPMALHTDTDAHIDWDAYQVHFVPNVYAENVSNAEFDLAVNSTSLLEMRQEDIDLYFHLIQKKNRVRYFYNYNRKERVEGDHTYKFEKMPYDEHWEHVLDQEAVKMSTWELQNHPMMERLSYRML